MSLEDFGLYANAEVISNLQSHFYDTINVIIINAVRG